MSQSNIAGISGAALIAALALAGQASAHAHLVKSDPVKDATVAAPAKIQLSFSEKLEAKFSGADLAKADGTTAPAAAKVAGKTITVTPSAPLAAGAYQVKWHVVSDDGHRMTGDYGFKVR